MRFAKISEKFSHYGNRQESGLHIGVGPFHHIKATFNELHNSEDVVSNKFRLTKESRQEFASGNAFSRKGVVFSETNGIAILKSILILELLEKWRIIDPWDKPLKAVVITEGRSR